MSIESAVAALTTATTDLLDAVNVKQASLDAAVASTAADRAATAADRDAVAADLAQTTLDVAATAADRVQTGADRAAVAADRALAETARTAAEAQAAAAAADRVQTGLDRTATGADRADVLAARLEAIALLASASAAALALPTVEVIEASRVLTAGDDQTLLTFTSSSDIVFAYLGDVPPGFVVALMAAGEGSVAVLAVDPALEIRTAGDGPLITTAYRTILLRKVSTTLAVLETADAPLPGDLTLDITLFHRPEASALAALTLL